MPYVGGPITAAPGFTRNQIMSATGAIIAGALRLKIEVRPQYRNRYYAIFANGIFQKCAFAPLIGDIKTELPIEPGSDIASLWIEDAGWHADFDPSEYQPNHQALVHECNTARRILFRWKGSYELIDPRGDSQLSSLTVTGAKRGVNVGKVEGFSSRGRLTYSITTVSTTHIIRFWAGQKLVAEGSRTGDGSFTCSEIESSGLTVTGTLTHSADLKPGTAYIDMIWSKQYQIHYSTSSLSFPRTPEATIEDDGNDDYLYLTPLLDANDYNYNIVPVDDNGNEQASPSAPSDSPVTVNQPPTAPTITGVTGDATGLVVAWSLNSESGATYKVYSSKPGYPINFGDFSAPAVKTTSADATSQTLDAVTDYTDEDYSSALSTVKSSFDSAISGMNTGFNSGEGSFLAAFNTGMTSLRSALDTFETAIGLTMHYFRTILTEAESVIHATEYTLQSTGLTTSEWQNAMGSDYGQFLALVSNIVEFNPARYTLPSGAIPGGAPAGNALGTGENELGGIADFPETEYSLNQVAQPLTRTRPVRIVVRAVKSGIEEGNGDEFLVRLNSSGNIINPKPNSAFIESITVDGLDVTVVVALFEDDAEAAAVTAELYAVAFGSSIDLTNSPQATASFGTAQNGKKKATINYTLPAAGYYRFAATALTAASERSKEFFERIEYIDNSGPSAVSNISATVIRGVPGKALEQ